MGKLSTNISTEGRWLKTALRLHGSVVLKVLPRSIGCGLVGLLLAYGEAQGWVAGMPALASLIPNIVLGLLLVFRTNTAYDRFWDGRKCWGMVTTNSRSLARQIWVAIDECNSSDRSEKVAILRLLGAFALSLKHHLREEPMLDLEPLVSPSQMQRLQRTSNPPLEILLWISDYLQTQCRKGRLHVQQLTALQGNLDRMVEALGGCERILKTPMPMAYAIHLKQLLLLYCLSLPFQMVGTMHWWTPVGVVLVAFMVFGIEAIGTEIENPFGSDPNDLPLDGICTTIARNIEDVVQSEMAIGGEFLPDPRPPILSNPL
jgi:ion channel-forming bestrophin family protein